MRISNVKLLLKTWGTMSSTTTSGGAPHWNVRSRLKEMSYTIAGWKMAVWQRRPRPTKRFSGGPAESDCNEREPERVLGYRNSLYAPDFSESLWMPYTLLIPPRTYPKNAAVRNRGGLVRPPH